MLRGCQPCIEACRAITRLTITRRTPEHEHLHCVRGDELLFTADRIQQHIAVLCASVLALRTGARLLQCKGRTLLLASAGRSPASLMDAAAEATSRSAAVKQRRQQGGRVVGPVHTPSARFHAPLLCVRHGSCEKTSIEVPQITRKTSFIPPHNGVLCCAGAGDCTGGPADVQSGSCREASQPGGDRRCWCQRL